MEYNFKSIIFEVRDVLNTSTKLTDFGIMKLLKTKVSTLHFNGIFENITGIYFNSPNFCLKQLNLGSDDHDLITVDTLSYKKSLKSLAFSLKNPHYRNMYNYRCNSHILSKFTNLHSLSLRNCFIDSFDFNCLSKLRLKYLDLSFETRDESDITPILPDMRRLKHLKLYNFPGEINSFLSNIITLIALELWYCDVNINYSFLNHMKQLEILKLTDVEGDNSNLFKSLKTSSVNTLDLSECDLDKSDIEQLRCLKNIRWLDISNEDNLFDSIHIYYLTKLNLEYLKISGDIDNSSCIFFKDMVSLKTLTFDNTYITDGCKKEILTHLKIL